MTAATAREITPSALEAVIFCLTLTPIATIAVALRFWARRIKGVRPNIEDWLILGGLFVEWAFIVCVILISYEGGLGVSTPELLRSGRMKHVENQKKLLLAGQILHSVILGLVKSSLCLSLIRIFSISRVFHSIAITVLILCVCWAMQSCLGVLLICTPPFHTWDQANNEGHCGNLEAGYMAVTAGDVITDCAIFLLPIPMIHRLNMPTRSKYAASGIFALGLIPIGAGILRMVAAIRKFKRPEESGDSINFVIWFIVEACMAITVACVLVMRPLFTRLGTVITSWFPRRTRQASKT